MNALLQPFDYTFMQRALLEIALMSVVCGVLGVFVVLRGLTYTGESLSHTLVPGAAVAVAVGASILPFAFAGAVLAVLVIALFAQRADVSNETAVGVVFSGAFAAGVIVLSITGTPKELDSVLFGNILAVGPRDLWFGGVATLVTLVIVGLFCRRLLAVAFDPSFARALQISPLSLDVLLLVTLALALTVALSAMGTLLVLAMLIAPAATARILTGRAWTMLWVAPLVGLLTGVAGLEISYHLDVAAGAAIALTAIALFTLVASGAALAAALARSQAAGKNPAPAGQTP
jgi:ABC-type Mn2+/Zn2+ transport system permease subunit